MDIRVNKTVFRVFKVICGLVSIYFAVPFVVVVFLLVTRVCNEQQTCYYYQIETATGTVGITSMFKTDDRNVEVTISDKPQWKDEKFVIAKKPLGMTYCIDNDSVYIDDNDKKCFVSVPSRVRFVSGYSRNRLGCPLTEGDNIYIAQDYLLEFVGGESYKFIVEAGKRQSHER